MLPAGSFRPATWCVHYTTSCNTQSSTPGDGQNNCPKCDELTGIVNKPLLLHLIGCLYCLYQWCTVKQISFNEIHLLIKYIKSVLWGLAKRLSYIEDARCLKVKRQIGLQLLTQKLFHIFKTSSIRVFYCFGGFPQKAKTEHMFKPRYKHCGTARCEDTGCTAKSDRLTEFKTLHSFQRVYFINRR